MNCAGYEALIALYVENDLTEEETGQVERHLDACGGCREFAAGLRESQAAFKALRFESVDESTYAEVRAGVLRETSTPRRMPGWRRYAVAAAVALAIVAGWMWQIQRQAPVQQPPAIVAKVPPASLVHAQAPAERTHHAPRVQHVARRLKSKPSFKSEPLLVKMITDDPDVVIYWLVDQNGG
ncbi:MAG TPA: zf-HC2 domain-containing protein [Bryobacteraceae bacterium]|nr:zf-HC2 domain-containing protein [Bryobacteraceae bacterium]